MTARLAAAVVLVLVLAVSTSGQPRGGPAGDVIRGGAAYRIGPEDVLQVIVWRNDTLSRSVTVRPDGMITLPLLNDVRAAGLTPLELRAVLTDRLKDQVSDPEVSIIVADLRSFKVTVMGEVVKPDRYMLGSKTTVLDLLAIAGGFTQQAARGKVVVLRPEGAAVRTIPFDYNKLVSSGGGAGNFELHPGDIVLVP
jgi:polysaccharide export outer membrane protein